MNRQQFTLLATLVAVLIVGVIYAVQYLKESTQLVTPDAGCGPGRCSYNPHTLECGPPNPDARTFCMSQHTCDNLSFPCVGRPGMGSLCPGQKGYNPTKSADDSYCTDTAVCASNVLLHFTEYGTNLFGQNKGNILGFFSQIGNKSCGLNDDARRFVVPQTCMAGNWAKYRGLWYCMDHNLPCDAILGEDGIYRCIG